MPDKEDKIDKEIEKHIRQSKDVTVALKKMLVELERQREKQKNKK